MRSGRPGQREASAGRARRLEDRREAKIVLLDLWQEHRPHYREAIEMNKYFVCIPQRSKRPATVYVEANDRAEAAALAWFKIGGADRPTITILDATGVQVNDVILIVMEE